MQTREATKLIVTVLSELQVLSGRSDSIQSNDLHPIGDLEEFDSLNAVEATMELSDRLGIELPINIFVSEDGTKVLTINQVAEKLSSLTQSTEMSS